MNILKLFIKSKVFENKAIWLQLKDVTLGFAAETSIATIKRGDEVTSEAIYAFRKDCRMLLIDCI